ncbi:HAMP domain-containing sensor histidine kinase [Corallincola platygyrae]|uniref:histidine kinase n=1 Tax=Corallincola platygyrae TaxID=1193278 RepID=A0ABW4XR27_9GAMM
MQLSGFRSLRSTLSWSILALALIPTLLTSFYLISRFQQLAEESAFSTLRQTANILANDIERDYQLLFTGLRSVSKDPDVIYASYTGVFGPKAKLKLADLAHMHPSAYGIFLVDKSGWPVEVVPTQFELLDLSPISARIDDYFANPIDATQKIETIKDAKFLDRVFKLHAPNIKQVKRVSDHMFVIYAPLWLSAVDRAEVHELVGALVVLMPVHAIYENANKKLKSAGSGETSMLDIISEDSLLNLESHQLVHDNFLSVKAPLTLAKHQAPVQIEMGIDRRNALAAIANLELKLWAIVGFLILLFAGVALIASRRIVSPLHKISGLVEQYSRADYHTYPLQLRFVELQRIVLVLDQMAERIQEDQRELEQRVEDRTHELKTTNEELTLTMERLKATQSQLVEAEKMSQLGQLVAGVAHEINTPVGVSVTAATLLQDEMGNIQAQISEGKLTRSGLDEHIAKTNQCAEMILSNLNRAAELIKNFKEVAVDQSSEQLREFNLHSYIRDLVSSLRPEFKHHKVSVDVRGDESLMLFSYPGAFSQILTNMMVNSVRHGFDQDNEHHIWVGFRVKDSFLELTYHDDGKGVDEENLKRLFDPFYTTRRASGGTGLGLHIVYNVVSQKLGGTIGASSAPGEGITFTLVLPLTPPVQSVTAVE